MRLQYTRDYGSRLQKKGDGCEWVLARAGFLFRISDSEAEKVSLVSTLTSSSPVLISEVTPSLLSQRYSSRGFERGLETNFRVSTAPVPGCKHAGRTLFPAGAREESDSSEL